MVTDWMLLTLGSLETAELELEDDPVPTAGEIRRPREGKCCAQGHTAIQNRSLNFSLGLLPCLLL